MYEKLNWVSKLITFIIDLKGIHVLEFVWKVELIFIYHMTMRMPSFFVSIEKKKKKISGSADKISWY